MVMSVDRDLALARALVERGALSRDVFAECLRLLDAERASGRPTTLVRLLVERGGVDKDLLLAVRRDELGEYPCPCCATTLRAKSVVPGRPFRCARCKTILVLAGDRSKLVARDVPPDAEMVSTGVMDAAVDPARRDSPPSSVVERLEKQSNPLGRLLGSEFAGHQVLEELGRGGMGAVYKARQLSTGRTVALKVLLGGDEASRTLIHRFEREADVLAALGHRNVVGIQARGVEGGYRWFSMDYLPGGTLKEYCAGAALSPAKAIGIFVRILSALQHAHRKGVLHRDLKPSNVLLDEGGEPVLQRHLPPLLVPADPVPHDQVQVHPSVEREDGGAGGREGGGRPGPGRGRRVHRGQLRRGPSGRD